MSFMLKICMLQNFMNINEIGNCIKFCNRSFAQSRFNSRIIHFWTPFKGVTSLIAKWYLLHERAIVSPKNIECVPFSYNLQLLEPCKRSANNFIATRKFTSCVLI
jgi:hypothetical protein